MTADTTTPSYWFNWRFLLCALWILVGMVFAALLIWRYEGHSRSRNRSSGDHQEAAGCLYEDEVWGTCSKSMHPIWLLAYRIVAFSALLAILLADIMIHGGGKYFFYTEWTFTLVTIYFGLGSSLSIHGCLRYFHEVELERDCRICTDADSGSYVPPSLEENAEIPSQNGGLNRCGEPNCRTAASLIVCKHSVNAVLLLGDAILNRLVALSFSGLVISICSLMVLSCRTAAFSVFWGLYPHIQDKAMLFIKITFHCHGCEPRISTYTFNTISSG
ncbi:hypothetical protein DH2020_048339 [Rehmannia glutinosa]|uniref:Uncharacterized protein n=1 Tax=Rehmannia glutinosa TaxID=99300 RepID=A0ABR0U630_REHGL